MSYSTTLKDLAERDTRRILRKALRDVGCRDLRLNHQLVRAARWVVAREQIETPADVKNAALGGRVHANIRGLLQLYRMNNVDRSLAYVALLDNWRLLLQTPEVTADNLMRARGAFGDFPWAQMGQHVFKLYASNPYLFSYDPIKAASAFKVNLTFMQSPFVSLGNNYTGSELRAACVNYIAGYFRKSSNIFARMVLAELAPIDPQKAHLDSYFRGGKISSAQSLHIMTRDTVSDRIADVLGQANERRVIDPPAWARTETERVAMQENLMEHRAGYERTIFLSFDANGPAVTSRSWQFKILSDISPTRKLPETAEEKNDLLARLLVAKIIKGYSFSDCKR